VDGKVVYEEGTFIGYRGHYADRAPRPMFWFGHGLGYSTWAYHKVEVDDSGETPLLRLTLTNTGDRDSGEVVQVYLEPAEADQPVRLVGWTPVTVAAGDTAQVEVSTDARLWRRWDSDAGSWTRIANGGRLLVARGLGDIRASLPL
jgi:beta-glucosidase